MQGRVWRNIKVEVAADEGQARAGVDVVSGVPLDHFGLPSTGELAVMVLEYQVAQKLHAVTDPDEPPDFSNDRVRDIVDLTLILDGHFVERDDLSELRAACEDIFSARGAEAVHLRTPPRLWPPTIKAHARWRAEYATMALDHGLDQDLDRAVRALNGWIGEIDGATRPG